MENFDNKHLAKDGNLPKDGLLTKKGRMTNRGRELKDEDIQKVQELLGSMPRKKDMLIEYLHLIQDQAGYLPSGMMQALAKELNLSMAAVWEVASFYHHFDLNQEQPAGFLPTIRICDSLTCSLYGGEALLAQVESALAGRAKVVPAPCMGLCDQAPAAMVGQNAVGNLNLEKIVKLVDSKQTRAVIPAYQDYDAYKKEGGFDLLNNLVAGKVTAEAIIQHLNDSGLRGLGGAGFPTGRKWDLVRAAKGTKMMAVNGDEGEPGTFKDREYLSTKPFQFLEGMLIAAKVVEASEVYIYLRDEYPAVREILTLALEKLAKEKVQSFTKISLRRGAGAYICGEESAMIESIEGKRGLPRHRPPYVAEKGLFGYPTLVNNVETLFWIAPIINHGAQNFADKGRHGAKGLRSYSVSGRVKNPGVKLTPAGITLNELIQEYCGGMADGHKLKAYLPGGASGGILPASLADESLDFGKLEKHGSFVGSHAVVILSDQDDLKAVVKNLTKFFADESCGQCTPCRAGCDKSLTLMENNNWDEALLQDLGQWMSDASICGLGQAAANPVKSLFRFFKEEV